jgi:hypothetical protein
MKILLLLASMLTSVSISNASMLVTATSFSGYGPSPEVKTLTLDASGLVVLETRQLRSGDMTTETLGQVAEAAMTKILSDISIITSDARLLDEQEGKPVCADGGSSSVRAVVEGRSVEITREAGCHHWRLEHFEGRRVARLVLAFLELR